MTRVKKRGRLVVLASYLVTGALLLQLGGCLTMALQTGVTAFDFSRLLDDNDLIMGIFAPCGAQNYMYVDEDGNPIDGVVYGTEDDLLWDCPVHGVLQPTGDGGGG